jgi:hypothetical protein
MLPAASDASNDCQSKRASLRIIAPDGGRYVVELLVPADAGIAEVWRERVDQIMKLPTQAPKVLLAMPSIDDVLEDGESFVRLRWVDIMARNLADAVQQVASIFEGLFSPVIKPARLRMQAWEETD